MPKNRTSDVLTDEEIDHAMRLLALYGDLCCQEPAIDLLTRYVAQGRPQCDGTLIAVLPNALIAGEDVRKAWLKLSHFCDIAEHMLAIIKIRTEMLLDTIPAGNDA